jgi:hypothetical protein
MASVLNVQIQMSPPGSRLASCGLVKGGDRGNAQGVSVASSSPWRLADWRT